MKHLLLLLLLGSHLLSYGQNKTHKLIGQYHDYFGNRIEIKGDSTFNYSWHFDMVRSWSKGTWAIKNDTIYFKTILIYDTLRYKKENGQIVDSLIVANDEKPKIITIPPINTIFSSGGQNRQPCPDKLYYKNEKLFKITKEGKLVKKKIKGFWTKKKWHPWYFKQIESN